MERQNSRDYADAARALHAMFGRFVAQRPELRDDHAKRDFDAALEGTVKTLIANTGDRDARILAWKAAIAEGAFTGSAGEVVPDYDPGQWRDALQGLATVADPAAALDLPAYRFQQAAATHRHYMLRELLPAHGIVLV